MAKIIRSRTIISVEHDAGTKFVPVFKTIPSRDQFAGSYLASCFAWGILGSMPNNCLRMLSAVIGSCDESGVSLISQRFRSAARLGIYLNNALRQLIERELIEVSEGTDLVALRPISRLRSLHLGLMGHINGQFDEMDDDYLERLRPRAIAIAEENLEPVDPEADLREISALRRAIKIMLIEGEG